VESKNLTNLALNIYGGMWLLVFLSGSGNVIKAKELFE
jgi:hypothetical protein